MTVNKAVDDLINEYSTIFKIKDAHGKYRAEFVEEVLQRVVKLEKEIDRQKTLQKLESLTPVRDCKECKFEPTKGDIFSRCFVCKNNYADQWRAK